MLFPQGALGGWAGGGTALSSFPQPVLPPSLQPCRAWEWDEAEELRDRGVKRDIQVDWGPEGAEGAEGLRGSQEMLGKKQQARNLGRWWFGPPGPPQEQCPRLEGFSAGTALPNLNPWPDCRRQ